MGASKAKAKSTFKQKKPLNPLIVLGSIFGGLLLIFGVLMYAENQGDKNAMANYNPYGDKDLNSTTIDLLSDDNYQSIILEKDLDKLIDSGDSTVAYFFSPTCEYCKKTTPILMPLAESMDVDIVQFNLLEYTNGWEKYKIEGTPTLVLYKDGKEVSRVTGQYGKDYFETWLTTNVLNNK